MDKHMPTTQKEIEDIFPLTSVQQFMLDNAAATPSGLAFQQQYTYYLDGDVDPQLCRKAWEIVVARHPAMRTSLHHQGTSRAFQVVHGLAPLPFAIVDLSHLDEQERDRRVFAFLREDARIPFNFHKPPLLRLALHKMEERLYVITLTLSHIIFDGWSLGVAFRHFVQAYGELSRGAAPDLTPLPSMHGYISWFRKRDYTADLAWWRERLSMAETPRLPFMNPSPGSRPIEADQLHHLVLTEEETGLLEQAARKMGITLNVLYQGAWALMLSRLSPERRALLLTVAASRPVDVSGIDQVFGLLLDGVPYNLECPGDMPLADWLRDLHALQLESLEHCHVPAQEWLTIGRYPGTIPYNSYLIFENMATGESGGQDEAFSIRAAFMNSNLSFPLSMMVFPGTILRVAIIYSLDFFTPEAIVRFSELLRRTLNALAQYPDKTLDGVSALVGLSEESMSCAVTTSTEGVYA
jgi:hypothetical protein